MKIRLELETADVQEMIQSYFLTKGYEVRNLDMVCAAFEDAYPDGIMVEAHAAVGIAARVAQAPVTEVAAKSPEVDEDTETIQAVAEAVPSSRAAEAPAVNAKANPRLSFSDLMDPTLHGMVPSRDELLQETQREIQQLLQASKSIEQGHTSIDD